jgi:hypothetical protein
MMEYHPLSSVVLYFRLEDQVPYNHLLFLGWPSLSNLLPTRVSVTRQAGTSSSIRSGVREEAYNNGDESDTSPTEIVVL